MGTKTTWTQAVNEAVSELEKLSDEIRVKLHLANMDARAIWDRSLEPKLGEARDHARQATQASKAAIDDTIEAFRRFAKSL